MEKIGKASTHLFDNYLVFALDKRWLEAFGELPQFEVAPDNKGRLHLVSTKSVFKK